MTTFIKKVIFEENRKFSSQKTTRIYHKDRKYLTNATVRTFYKKLKEGLKPNETLMIRAMTEFGPRTLLGFDDGDIKFQSTEEYLDGTSNPEAKAYKRISYIDAYVVKNSRRGATGAKPEKS